MDITLQAKLYKMYPHFFRRPRHLNRTTSTAGPLDYWGIECGTGWYELVNDLAKQFEDHIQNLIAQNVPKRYWPRALQVKEKMGTLCISTSNSRRCPEPLVAAIRQAEAASAVICEICGGPGILRKSGYHHVACTKCSKSKWADSDDDINGYLLKLRVLLAERRC